MYHIERYQRNPIVHFPEREWPNREIEKAPIWCSVDLRDGNQALVEPMVVEEKTEMFNLLLKLGFKEIEIGFPAASQIEFDFLRLLALRKMIPSDVHVQVLTQCREHLIHRTFEAIEGIPKLRIEESAARTQARIDSGRQALIGVNKYVVPEDEQIEVLKVDNTKVRAEQLAKLKQLRAERDEAAVQAALEALTAAAAKEDKEPGNLDENLLKLSVDAARAKATVGEISYALEKVFGRHEAEIRTLSGVYKDEVGKEGAVGNVEKAIAMADAFEAEEGRRPRIYIAKMGQDGHDRGQKVVASAYADLGMDVDVGPLFQTPAEAASAPAASNENQTETHAPPLKKSEISPRKDKSKSEQTNEEDEKELTPKYPIIIEADTQYMKKFWKFINAFYFF